MAKMIVVVEQFELSYGVEEKRVFKSFKTVSAFEDYCITNHIQILRGAFGTRYYDDHYGYLLNHIEYFE